MRKIILLSQAFEIHSYISIENVLLKPELFTLQEILFNVNRVLLAKKLLNSISYEHALAKRNILNVCQLLRVN